MSLMFQPLRKYADFTGRARRSEYWLFSLLLAVIYAVVLAATGGFAVLADPAAAAAGGMGGLGLFALVVLAMFLPSLAVTVRRLHDSDRSGWWFLVAFVPFVGGIVMLIFALIDGTPGPNRYGPDPKGRAGAAYA